MWGVVDGGGRGHVLGELPCAEPPRNDAGSDQLSAEAVEQLPRRKRQVNDRGGTGSCRMCRVVE